MRVKKRRSALMANRREDRHASNARMMNVAQKGGEGSSVSRSQGFLQRLPMLREPDANS